MFDKNSQFTDHDIQQFIDIFTIERDNFVNIYQYYYHYSKNKETYKFAYVWGLNQNGRLGLG